MNSFNSITIRIYEYNNFIAPFQLVRRNKKMKKI